MTFEKVREIIANQLSINKDKIVETTVLGEDLGADSLDMVEVLMSLEDEFGVSIPDEEIPNIKTVKDLVEFIDNNK
ncbi:MAG: acyl carrier protein [Clostridia bacterium]|nr:acyl carrier protein [Clostridia bacterium]